MAFDREAPDPECAVHRSGPAPDEPDGPDVLPGVANMMQIKKFLARYGRYRTTADLFYHRQLRQRLAEIGFRVITIERLATHPVWEVRLKGNLDVQANLLLGQPLSERFGSPSRYWLEQQLKRRIQGILNTLGDPVRSDEITVARTGTYFQAAFVWPKGTPGVLGRSAKKVHPYQVAVELRRWLRRQRN
jgi:hypothetical protein